MSEKRFFILQLEDDDLPCIRDRTFQLDDIYGHYKYDNLEQLCSFLNEQHEENQQLNKILKIIADAESFRVENSVKEILRNNLFGLDTVAGESFNAYKDYTLLNNFFKEHYGEHWDNDKYD